MARGKQPKSSELRAAIATRLKAARFAYNENAAQVARDLGVTPQVLNAYEKARNYPDETFLVRFCDLTGCPSDWILRGRMEAVMPPVMASRIGVHFPELVEGLDAEGAAPRRVAERETAG